MVCAPPRAGRARPSDPHPRSEVRTGAPPPLSAVRADAGSVPVVPAGQTCGMRWKVVSTPIGDVSLATDDAGLCRVHFGRYEGQAADPGDPVLAQAARQLD